MRLALEDAGLDAGGCRRGLRVGERDARLDRVEARRARRRSSAARRPVVTSIKGALGESGASGSAGVRGGVLCGRDGRVPPIAGLDRARSRRRVGCGWRATADDAPGPIVLVNSFASGGALFSVVLRVAVS